MRWKEKALLSIIAGMLLIFGWRPEATSASLSLDKSAYTVQAGATQDGIAHIIASSTDAGGRLVFTVTNTAVATVSPAYVIMTQGPQGYVDMTVPFTLTGVSGGGTIIQVQAFSPGASTPFIQVSADITVVQCPAGLALEGDPQQVERLRTLHDFRDSVLAKTPMGRHFTALFYEHAWEGSYLLLRHPELLQQTRDLLDMLMPTIETVVSGGYGFLTASEIAAIEQLMNELAAKGSPGLQDAIEQVRFSLRSGQTISPFGIEPEKPLR